MKSASQVGLLVVAFGVLAWIGLRLLTGGFSRSGDYYIAAFEDAAGAQVGSPVLMAGIQIGVVTRVRLASPTSARLTLELTPGTPVPVGTRAQVATSLIGLGETPVYLVPPNTSGKLLKPGAVLLGSKSGPLDSMLPNGGRNTIRDLNATLVSLRDFLSDKRLRSDLYLSLEGLGETLDQGRMALSQVAALSANGDRLLSANAERIANTLQDAQAAAKNLEALTATFKNVAGDRNLQLDLHKTADQLANIAQKSGELVADVQKLTGNPQFTGDLAQTARNMKNLTASLGRSAKTSEDIAKNADVITKKSIDLPDKIATIADKATQIEDQLSKLVQKVTGVLGKGGKMPNLKSVTAEMDLTRETQPDHWRTDFNVKFPVSDGFVHAGMYDAFESNRITLQFGRLASPKLEYRYGVYASKPGIGVDWDLLPGLQLSGNIWDINSPRLDSQLKYDFGNGIYGWIGFNGLLRTNAPLIGMGIRR